MKKGKEIEKNQRSQKKEGELKEVREMHLKLGFAEGLKEHQIKKTKSLTYHHPMRDEPFAPKIVPRVEKNLYPAHCHYLLW